MNAEQMIMLSQKLVLLSLAKDDKEKKKLTQEIALLNSQMSDNAEKNIFCRPLKFTDKEISKMPKTFRKEFRIEGCTAHVRKRSDARYRCSYEIRYRKNGYNISASARTLAEAKENFIQKLHVADRTDKNGSNNVPIIFYDFALFWAENYHKRKVCERTYKNTILQIKRSFALQSFAQKAIRKIKANELQIVIDDYVIQEKFRAAQEVHSILNQIFAYAVKYGLIIHNPVELVFLKKHEQKHGKALSFAEERKLLAETAGTPYQLIFAVALYTGMRPNEYATSRINGNMIIAQNSKRKTGKIEYKRIPIIKMLKPYLNGLNEIKWLSVGRIRKKFNTILPDHHLYDLRTTFYTRCQMFGVAESARDEMVGHSGGVLSKTYTDLPDEFLLKEAEKLVW